MNHRRQMQNLHFALFLKLLDRGGLRKISGKIKNGTRGKFRVDYRCAVGKRSSERIPARRNVSADLVESVFFRFGSRSSESGSRVQQENAKQADAKLFQFLHEVNTPRSVLGSARCGTSSIVACRFVSNLSGRPKQRPDYLGKVGAAFS